MIYVKINNIFGPIGVYCRNSHNELIAKHLNWEPKVDYDEGLAFLYDWVKQQVTKQF